MGFFESARYPPVSTGIRGGRKQTPHFVATVAAWNEFGNRAGVPERPFFRRALTKALPDVRATIREGINTRTMVVDRELAGKVGEVMKGHLQESIIDLKRPPNAPATIKRKSKRGKTANPLIDTAKMLRSIAWKIDSPS